MISWSDGGKVVGSKNGKGTIEYAIQAGGEEPAHHDGWSDPGFNVHGQPGTVAGDVDTLGARIFYLRNVSILCEMREGSAGK